MFFKKYMQKLKRTLAGFTTSVNHSINFINNGHMPQTFKANQNNNHVMTQKLNKQLIALATTDLNKTTEIVNCFTKHHPARLHMACIITISVT